MARLMPILPVIRPTWKLQPVHAADLGKAIALAALDPKTHAGQTYELGGPNVMTMAELNRWICETTGRRRALAELPDPIGKAIARVTGWLPMAPLTWDQWLMMQPTMSRPAPASTPSASTPPRSPRWRRPGWCPSAGTGASRRRKPAADSLSA